jgi:hypothetical protein
MWKVIDYRKTSSRITKRLNDEYALESNNRHFFTKKHYRVSRLQMGSSCPQIQASNYDNVNKECITNKIYYVMS